MIDVRELRVGNWVTDNFDKANPFVPTKISLDDFVAMSQGCNNYHPIPLTEEILLKCGFELVRGELCLNLPNCGDWNFQLYNSEDSIEIQVQYEYSTSLKRIKSVHQLQNLYFALAIEELNVEL